MKELVIAIKSLLEVIERMAGGKKKAQIVFWVLFVILVAIVARPAWDSVAYIIGKFNIRQPIVNALASAILLVVGFAGLFALFTLIAAVPAQFIRSMLDSAFRIRLNDTFIALLDKLQKAEQESPNDEQIHQLLEDTKFIYKRWQQSKTNVFVGWIVPNYFKKDPSKWKLVSKNIKSEANK